MDRPLLARAGATHPLRDRPDAVLGGDRKALAQIVSAEFTGGPLFVLFVLTAAQFLLQSWPVLLDSSAWFAGASWTALAVLVAIAVIAMLGACGGARAWKRSAVGWG